jgi:vacuolar-type H+-ATPase subunit F/Vma7
VKFAVGFKLNGTSGHVVVDAEDALIAALRVKAQRPEAAITYARRQNKRGDARHPQNRPSGEGR